MLAESNVLADSAGGGMALRGTSPASRPGMRRLAAAGLIITGLYAAGCDDPVPNTPSPQSTNLTGTWRGPIDVAGTSATMTWTLTQASAGVSGLVVIALPNGVVLLNGNLSGSVNGQTLTYVIAVPPGGIQPQPACSGQIGGTTILASTTVMNGNYAVTSSTCPTGLTTGTFTLIM